MRGYQNNQTLPYLNHPPILPWQPRLLRPALRDVLLALQFSGCSLACRAHPITDHLRLCVSRQRLCASVVVEPQDVTGPEGPAMLQDLTNRAPAGAGPAAASHIHPGQVGWCTPALLAPSSCSLRLIHAFRAPCRARSGQTWASCGWGRPSSTQWWCTMGVRRRRCAALYRELAHTAQQA